MKRIFLKYLKFVIIVIMLVLLVRIFPSIPQVEYVYYGVIPGRIYQYIPIEETDLSRGWYILPASVADHGYISILALQDSTVARVYTLPDKKLVSEVMLNRMQKQYIRLPNGTMFKIVSNKLVSVIIISPPARGIPGVNATEGPIVTGFYTSIEGAYVGKEFIIDASQALLGFSYHIFALEDTKVAITDESGETQSFNLKANSYQRMNLKPLTTYRIVSTGNIMVQSGATDETGYIMRRSFFVPSAEGGFLGKRFYSKAIGTYDVMEENFFVISALEDTKVTVWNLAETNVISEFYIKAGEYTSFKPKAYAIAVDSDKPVTLQFLHSGSIKSASGIAYGVGFSYMGIRPNETIPFVLPGNSTIYAYIFADEETSLIIDDIPITVRPDEPFLLSTPGFHTIHSNKNLLMLLLHYPLMPEGQGIYRFGITVPCIKTVDFSPSVILSPISETVFTIPVSYIILLAMLILIIIIVVILKRKK